MLSLSDMMSKRFHTTKYIVLRECILCAHTVCADEACRPFYHKGWERVDYSFGKHLVTHPADIREMTAVLPLVFVLRTALSVTD